MRAASSTSEGRKGYADVWRKGCFGWEYKKKHADLGAAYQQLLRYREALLNPPLLVVCDLDRFEVHTNFPNTAKDVHAFAIDGSAGDEGRGGRPVGKTPRGQPAGSRPEGPPPGRPGA